jgi:hypothetical protein
MRRLQEIFERAEQCIVEVLNMESRTLEGAES